MRVDTFRSLIFIYIDLFKSRQIELFRNLTLVHQGL